MELSSTPPLFLIRTVLCDVFDESGLGWQGNTVSGNRAALLWGPLGPELGQTHMSNIVCKASLMLISASCWIQLRFVVGRAFCWSVGIVDWLQQFVSGPSGLVAFEYPLKNTPRHFVVQRSRLLTDISVLWRILSLLQRTVLLTAESVSWLCQLMLMEPDFFIPEKNLNVCDCFLIFSVCFRC